MQTKKNHVIQVAKQLFKEKGVSDYSVQDIIERSGISKGTFYNYFSSKNEFFIAYLQAAKAEELRRREALMEGKSVNDRNIFAQQILVRVHVNREYTLLPIFEIAFYSRDEQLKQHTQQRYVDELAWVATRLVDLYGTGAQMYAEDCAVLLHGMLQNTVQTYKLVGNESIDFLAIIHYVLQQIDLLMKRMIIVQDIPLFANDFMKNITKDLIVVDDIRQSLLHLQETIPEELLHVHESIQFLMEELEREHLRVHIARPVVLSLKNMLDRTKWARSYDNCYELFVRYLYFVE